MKGRMALAGPLKALEDDNEYLREQLKKQALRADALLIERDNALSAKRNFELLLENQNHDELLEELANLRHELGWVKSELTTRTADLDELGRQNKCLAESLVVSKAQLEKANAEIDVLRNKDMHSLRREVQEYQTMIVRTKF